MRWGETGRVCLTLAGPRSGKWRDWRDDTGGDALDLIEQHLSLNRAEAIAWVEEWFGGTIAQIDHHARAEQQKAAAADADRTARFKRQVAADIWNGATAFADSPAERYMLQTRFPGHRLPEAIYRCGALRWSSEETVDGSIGAMIGLMTDPVSGKPSGVHRTYIGADFQKVGRKMLGPWGVVRLWRDEEVTSGLSIGEGIESTIAGVLMTKQAPAWAALDAGGIAGFPVLAAIDCLSIFVDNDASSTGQNAAQKCGERWADAGRQATLFEPKRTGADFNHILLERAA